MAEIYDPAARLRTTGFYHNLGSEAPKSTTKVTCHGIDDASLNIQVFLYGSAFNTRVISHAINPQGGLSTQLITRTVAHTQAAALFEEFLEYWTVLYDLTLIHNQPKTQSTSNASTSNACNTSSCRKIISGEKSVPIQPRCGSHLHLN